MLKDVLDRIADKPSHAPLPTDVRQYLESHRIPADIIEDLAQSSYDEWLPVGPVDVIPMPRLIKETTGIAVCVEHGFLPVAGCRNFDVVVVDRRTRRISYVSHDLLWSDDWSDIRECLRDSPFLYEEFWERAATDPSMPTDYYEAERCWPKVTGET